MVVARRTRVREGWSALPADVGVHPALGRPLTASTVSDRTRSCSVNDALQRSTYAFTSPVKPPLSVPLKVLATKKLKPDKFFMASHLRTTGCQRSIVSRTILLAARHKLAHPTLTPASKAGTRFTYPGGMEGQVDLGALITPRPGVEPTIT